MLRQKSLSVYKIYACINKVSGEEHKLIKTTGIRHICVRLSPFDHQEQNYYPAPVYYIYKNIKKTILYIIESKRALDLMVKGG